MRETAIAGSVITIRNSVVGVDQLEGIDLIGAGAELWSAWRGNATVIL